MPMHPTAPYSSENMILNRPAVMGDYGMVGAPQYMTEGYYNVNYPIPYTPIQYSRGPYYNVQMPYGYPMDAMSVQTDGSGPVPGHGVYPTGDSGLNTGSADEPVYYEGWSSADLNMNYQYAPMDGHQQDGFSPRGRKGGPHKRYYR